jgi:hypothetical protein
MTTPRDESKNESADEARRDALKKIAIYSAYSAPALLALMKPAKANVSSIPR